MVLFLCMLKISNIKVFKKLKESKIYIKYKINAIHAHCINMESTEKNLK